MNGSTGNSNLTSLNSPQSRVAGHFFAAGFVFRSQLVVLQVTAPGVPDLPAATPHLVAHPLASPCSQLPKSVGVKKYNEQLKQRRNHRVEMEGESCVYVRMNSLIVVLVMIVDIQDEDEAMVQGPVQNWHCGIKRTTIHGFKALFSNRLRFRVTTGRVATHCARGSRFACPHSTLCGTSAGISLYPNA